LLRIDLKLNGVGNLISRIKDTIDNYITFNTLYKKGFIRQKPKILSIWKCQGMLESIKRGDEV
jgi:hypothetical protein